MDRVANSPITEKSRVTALEAFRAKYVLPRDFVIPADTESVLRSLGNTPEPTIRPLHENSVNNEDKQRWRSQFIKLFYTDTRNKGEIIADNILANIERVDQKTFEESLINSFRASQRVLTPQVLEKSSIVYFSGGGERSTVWARNLLKDHFPQDPITKVGFLDYYRKDIQNEDTEVGIILDDATYSGKQVKDHIRRGKERFGLKRFVTIVPFVTQDAIDIINATAQNEGVKIDIFYDRKMKTAREILGEADYDYVRKMSNPGVLNAGQTLTYFAHKVPDFRSLFPYIGNTRHAEEDSRINPLIKETPAVYKKEYFDWLKSVGFKGFK